MPRTSPNLSKHHAQSPQSQPAKNVKLTLYVGFFAVGYILASAVFMIIQTQVTLSPQLVTALSVVVGAYIAVHKFIKHQRRTLTVSEMNRLTVGSIGTVWLLTVVYLLGLWFWLFDTLNREMLLEMVAQQPLPLLSALVMILLLTLVSARVGIWGFNRLLMPK